MQVSVGNRLIKYFRQILYYRHFWVHLALSDLRARFRRSYLGMLWITLQPLTLTIIMSTVFVFVFHQTFEDYSIYLFSGLVTWNFITGSFLIGSTSLITAEGYIKQVRLPIAIYPLKAVIYCCIVFALEFCGFALYTLVVKPSIISFHWLYLLPFSVLLILFCAPITIISSIINIKFRDFQQLIGLVLQMLLYVSPVMIVRSVFEHPGLKEWTMINPFAAIMDALRLPLLEGVAPDLSTYAILLLWSAALWVFAIYYLHRNERRIVFYY
ncbi:MAG: ABC transporter permease [Alphaproteobacteria bacterium]